MIFFLCGPAERVVVVPDQLDDGVVGFGAGVGEEHLGHRHRRHLDQRLGQIDAGIVRLVREGVVERQLPHLPRGRFHQPLLAEAEGRAPQAGHALDIGLAAVVEDVHAFAALYHQRTHILMGLQVGVGVQIVGLVAACRRVADPAGHFGHFLLFKFRSDLILKVRLYVGRTLATKQVRMRTGYAGAGVAWRLHPISDAGLCNAVADRF